MNNPVEEFKIRFNEAIGLRNIKPVELSEKTGISKSTISHYMSGYTKPKSDKLYTLAKALNVNVTWLMGYNVPMEGEVNHINFNDKIDDTPFNRALAKLDTDKESLTEEEKQAIKDELPKIKKRIPEVFEKFANDINDMLEERLLVNYRYLNPEGKTEALKRIEELTYIPKYTNEDHPILNAAHAIEEATEEDKQHDDDLMDNDEFWK
nr:helix-turn-helix domain-containing protein [uncultured Anaerocolumna sp.]